MLYRSVYSTSMSTSTSRSTKSSTSTSRSTSARARTGDRSIFVACLLMNLRSYPSAQAQREHIRKDGKYKISKIIFFKNLILVVLEPRDYQNLLGHVI